MPGVHKQTDWDGVQPEVYGEKTAAFQDAVAEFKRGQDGDASSDGGQNTPASPGRHTPGSGVQISMATGKGGRVYGETEGGRLPGPGASRRRTVAGGTTRTVDEGYGG